MKIQNPKEVVRIYQMGRLSTTQLAARFGVSPVAIRYHLRKAGVSATWRRTHKTITTPENRAIRGLYESGRSTTEIGRILEIHPSTVVKRLRKLKVDIRPPGRSRKLPDGAELRHLYEACGLTTVQIGAMYAARARTVVAALHRAGANMRRFTSKRISVVCAKPGCVNPTAKITHSINGSIYGILCLEHRTEHYRELNRWLARKNRFIPPSRWRYQHEVPDTPEAKVVSALMAKIRESMELCNAT